jgi:hypothetical protein
VTNIGLVGHSHAIAFLDAIAVWRPLAGLDQTVPAGFSEAHRGWLTELTGSAFVLDAKPEYAQFTGIKTVLFTAAMPLALVTVRNTDSGEEIALSAPLRRCLTEIAGCDTIISILYGSEVPAISFYKQFSDDDFADYDFAPYEAPGAHLPIDYRYIAAHLNAMAAMAVVPLKVIRRAMPAARIIHIAPPPPVEDPSQLAYTESAAARLSRTSISRPALRMKWHIAYVQTLRRLLWQDGIQVLEAPRKTISESGFLRDEYADSITHANESYGRLMAEHVGEFLFGPTP